jgi:hypothetical protein
MSNEVRLTDNEDRILTFDVTDDALEKAANVVKECGGALTVSFCSGLDTCPA